LVRGSLSEATTGTAGLVAVALGLVADAGDMCRFS
jgi:hypothetical protein